MIERRYRLDQAEGYLLDGQPLRWVGFAHNRERLHQLWRTDGSLVELSDTKIGQLARTGRFRSTGRVNSASSTMGVSA